MNEALDHIWGQVRGELERRVKAHDFEIFLAPLTAVGVDGAELVVHAPPEIRTWVTERYTARILQAAQSVLGPEAGVRFVADLAPKAKGRGPTRGADVARADAAQAASDSPVTRIPDPELNPKWTFEQFVIGDANRFAHAAALAVAEQPGQTYSPLFIYGPPGVGKTHLLHSIGNYVRAYGDGLTVRYTTVEHFTNDFVSSTFGPKGAMTEFKTRYRDVDVLLIDDVQFLESKAKTETEFFHTFNALNDLGSQLVLTSDRVPGDLAGLEDRLRARFEAGLVTQIAPPDLATRVAVLRKRAQHDGLAIEPDVLLRIAERISTNVRALEGALIRVVAFASLTGKVVSSELAGHVLDDLYGRPKPFAAAERVTVPRIQEVVCDHFGLTRDELLSETRTSRIAFPRQIAMYLARDRTDETLPAIGRQFGGRNHTTVMHAVRRVEERLAADPDVHDVLRRLGDRLAAGPDRNG